MRLDEMLHQEAGWLALVQAWWMAREGEATTTADLYKVAKAGRLLNGLTYRTEHIERCRLGWRMRQQAGQVYGGFRVIRMAPRDREMPEYCLEKVG